MQDKVSARLFEAEMGKQPQPHPQFFALRGLCNAMQKSSLLRLLQLHNSTFGFTSHLGGISGYSNKISANLYLVIKVSNHNYLPRLPITLILLGFFITIFSYYAGRDQDLRFEN